MHQTHEFFVDDSNVMSYPGDASLSNSESTPIDPLEMQLSYQISRPLSNKNRISGVGSVLGDTPVIYTNDFTISYRRNRVTA